MRAILGNRRRPAPAVRSRRLSTTACTGERARLPACDNHLLPVSPLAHSVMSAPDAASPTTTSTHAVGPRILVVDEEPRNRHLIEVILVSEGYRLISVASGAEALAAVAHDAPDLILLDIMMPGINGYRVLSALKGSDVTAHIPVVLVSALDDASSQAHGLNLGADAFLTKPVSRANLSEIVKQLLQPSAGCSRPVGGGSADGHV